MAKFNEKVKNTVAEYDTVNHEGALAYSESAENELYSLVCTSILKNKFYETEKNEMDRLRKLVSEADPAFVVKLAWYARNRMYLRSIPLVLMVELAKVHSGDNLISEWLPHVISRADEITETLAYYQVANERSGLKKLNSLSTQIQKGVAASFHNFGEYHFAKYDRKGDITFVDAIRLTHPVPENKEQEALWGRLIKGELRTPDTWEVRLSQAGQDGRDKKEVWKELIDAKTDKGYFVLPYMALLRNLRNMLDAKVPKTHLTKVAKRLADPKAVHGSKQLPFRFYTAYKMLMGHGNPNVSMILEALNKAIWASVDNFPLFSEEDTVFITVDISGSMEYPITPSINRSEIAILLGVLLRKRCKAVTLSKFGSGFAVQNIPENANVLDAVNQLVHNDGLGHATNAYLAFEHLNECGYDYNRVFVFSDMQVWDTGAYRGWNAPAVHDSNVANLWNKYWKTHRNARVYLVDLAGYGDTPIDTKTDQGAYLIAGWSNQIFKMIEAIESGKSAINVIKAINLDTIK